MFVVNTYRKQRGSHNEEGEASLFYIEAATGTDYRLLSGLPWQQSIHISGDQAFFVDGHGTVRAYHLQLRRGGRG